MIIVETVDLDGRNLKKDCPDCLEQPSGKFAKREAHQQIIEILVLSQFKFWVDGKPTTAIEISNQNKRAIDYYLGKVNFERSQKATCFRNIIEMQAAEILREFEKLLNAEKKQACDLIDQKDAEIKTFAEWRGRLEKQAKIDNAVVKYATAKVDQLQAENKELREANGHYLEVCLENQVKDETIANLQAEIQDLKKSIR